ncbi:MAG: 3-carboxyethylcatechol 2,3-dioxygenase, partial [Solirubrobacteraceae bacterium]
SHSPLIGKNDPEPEVLARVQEAVSTAKTFISNFDPQLVVLYAPDHYNGFFYDLMPPFCIGYEALGVGDYGTTAGPLDVPTETAERLAQWVAERDIDVAISRRMEIDHGAIQPLEILFGGIDLLPTIPVFVNGVAKPFTTMRRVRRLGESVGSFLARLDERVLVIGSGGLSHDPPVPQWATATEQQRALLLDGRHPSVAARHAREQNVINAARAFAQGTATIQDLNPEWDRALMATLASGDLSAIDAMTPERMAADAGNSAHEVRTWVAAFSALAAAGPYAVQSAYYRPIKEYIAGFGVMTARTV